MPTSNVGVSARPGLKTEVSFEKDRLLKAESSHFSTFDRDGYLNSSLLETDVSKSGIIRESYKGFTLVSLGHRSHIEFKLATQEAPICINVWYELASNVGYHFYTNLNWDDGRSSFRVTKDTISELGSDKIFRADFKVRRRVSYFLSSGSLVAFAGEDLFSNEPLRGKRLESISFELHEGTADLEATVLGFEVVSFSEQDLLEKIVDFNRDVQAAILASLESENFEETLRNLKRFNSEKVELSVESLWGAVNKLSSTEVGNKYEILKELVGFLPLEKRASFLKLLEEQIPEPLVDVKSLHVQYDRESHKKFTLSRLFFKRSSSFNVLNDINFSVYPGDIIGILGANGAGKSTLLKAISGILDITGGQITLRGKHMLLASGLGMRGELSGRDNIKLACCFMGIPPKQSVGLIEEVIEFSELRDSIDQPFKFYSDGMRSRLAFSVATAVAPEVLMLDEILGAGDIAFQQKASRRMDDLLGKAKAVILVTHSLQVVERKCNKCLVIADGKQAFWGLPKEAINVYLNSLYEKGKLERENISTTGFLGEMR